MLDDHWWFIDKSDDPDFMPRVKIRDRKKGGPNEDGKKIYWQMYEDHISVMLERAFHKFRTGKGPKSIKITPIFEIVFADSDKPGAYHVQRQIHDICKWRKVKRGEKGQRSNRPSADKFLNNNNFLLGEFKAKFGAEER